jgi:DNA invertase Pin-like site-specific DNA recombinase
MQLRQGSIEDSMAIVGYARVSSTDQDLDIQLEALSAAGCEEIFAEKASGTSTKGREELKRMLSFVRKGDTVVITRIGRLGRSVLDLHDIVKQLEAKGVALKATMQPIDTSDAAGRAFFGMLTVFAEFETNLRRERQLDGIAKAKKQGVYKGRKATIKPEEVRKLRANGLGPAAIAKQLKIGRASVYRVLGSAA